MSLETEAHRAGWITALFDLSERERCNEIRQILVDVLDVVEQEPLEEPVLAALAAYDAEALVQGFRSN